MEFRIAKLNYSDYSYKKIKNCYFRFSSKWHGPSFELWQTDCLTGEKVIYLTKREAKVLYKFLSEIVGDKK